MGSAFDGVLGAPAARKSVFDDVLPPAAPAAPVDTAPLGNGNVASAAAAQATAQPGGLEAIGRGLKQGVTLGFGDELTGLVESMLTEKSYAQARDEARANDAAAKKAHPYLYGAGEIGGGAAGMLVPGMGLARGVKGAAALGALAGLGGSEADLTKGEFGKAAVDTAVGAGTGAALGFVADKAGRWITGAPERAAAAEVAGLKEGVQNSTKVRAFGKNGANEADIISTLKANPEIRQAIAKNPQTGAAMVEAKLSDLGTKLDHIYDSAQDAVPGVKTADVVKGMEAVKAHYGKTSATKALADQVQSSIDNFTAQWPDAHIPFQDLRAEYRAFQDMGFEGGPMFSVPVAKQLKRDISTAMRDVLQSEVDRVATRNPSLGISKEALQSLNKEASTWSRIQSIVDEKATRAPAAAPPLGGLLHKFQHPLRAAGEAVGNAGQAFDAGVLGPTVQQLQRNPLAQRIASGYPALRRGMVAASPDLPGLAATGLGQAMQPGDQ